MHCIVLVKLLLKGWAIKINCDLCGKVEENLQNALIEGVELSVCGNCSKFGKIIAPVKRFSAKEQHKMFEKQKTSEEKEDKVELLVEGYADIIKKKREFIGMTQKDFANKISEKESIIHKIESGTWQPDLALAKKLEKVLGVKLVEEHLEKYSAAKKKKEEGFTLGDFIKIKN